MPTPQKLTETLNIIANSPEKFSPEIYRHALRQAIDALTAPLPDLPDEVTEGKAYDEVKEMLRDFYGYKKFDDNLTVNIVEAVAPHIIEWVEKETRR